MRKRQSRNLLASSESAGSTERIPAWECIGCGKIESPQPCIGICQDRKIEFVYATDHDEALKALADMKRRLEVLTALARQIARTTPREGGWEPTYRALQDRARRILDDLAAAKL